MTGLERLRKEANRFVVHFDIEAHELRNIADQIERETLPRPRFEDGTPVQFGDEVLVKCPDGDFCGELYQVAFDGEEVTLTNIDGEIVHITQGQRVKRPSADTWERIEADVDSGNGYEGMDAAEVAADVLRRCKALAGVE